METLPTENTKLRAYLKPMILSWDKIVLVVIMMLSFYQIFNQYYARFSSPRLSDYTLDFENTSKEFDEIIKQLRDFKQSNSLLAEEVIQKKKSDLLNIAAVSFHYANKDQIMSFYNDYFKEPTIEKMIAETVNEVTGDLRGELPQLIEAKAGGRNLKKWISTIKIPDISLNEMFKRYQRETIKNNQVTIGLEVLDVDLDELERFDGLISKLQTEFSVTLAKEKITNKQLRLKEKAAEKTLSRLENITSWVLIEGKFTISKFANDYYKLTYMHPVNKYLSKSTEKVSITITLKKDAIEPHVSGNYAQSIGESIPLKIYGKIWQPLDRNYGNWEVQVTPLAIY